MLVRNRIRLNLILLAATVVAPTVVYGDLAGDIIYKRDPVPVVPRPKTDGKSENLSVKALRSREPSARATAEETDSLDQPKRDIQKD